jgi:hypothetical protein
MPLSNLEESPYIRTCRLSPTGTHPRFPDKAGRGQTHGVAIVTFFFTNFAYGFASSGFVTVTRERFEGVMPNSMISFFICSFVALATCPKWRLTHVWQPRRRELAARQYPTLSSRARILAALSAAPNPPVLLGMIPMLCRRNYSSMYCWSQHSAT